VKKALSPKETVGDIKVHKVTKRASAEICGSSSITYVGDKNVTQRDKELQTIYACRCPMHAR
jgi:hypothetical protein